jgi:group I intron endonuclease
MAPAIVYLITNTANGKRYVGLTRYTLAKRWGEHKGCAAAGKKPTLYAAMRKYGPEAFAIEQVASCLSLEHATAVERAVIQSLKPEYNMTNGGEFTLGKRVLSKEAAERIRVAHVGKVITAEQRSSISNTLKARYASDPKFKAAAVAALVAGRSRIDRSKQRAAVSKALSRRVWSDESRQRLSEVRKGIRHTEEVLRRIAAKKNKAVECITLAATFDSASEAADATGLHVSTISKACLGKLKTAGGLQFRYV